MFSKLFSNSNKLETAERQIISLRDELKRTLERLDAAENSRRQQDRLKEQLETALSENKNLENKIRILTRESEDFREEARVLKSSVRSLTKEKSEALEKLLNQSDHENEKKQYVALELNNKSLKTNLDQLQSTLNVRTRELTEVINELKDSRETNKKQSAEIQELRVIVDEAKRVVSVETSKKNEKIKNLESALSDSRKSLSDEKIKSQTWNRLLVDLKRDYDKLKSEESKLKIENEKLEKRVDAPRPQRVTEQQLKNAHSELSRLKEKFNDLEQKHKLIVKASKSKEAALQEELQHARQRNRRLLEKLENAEHTPTQKPLAQPSKGTTTLGSPTISDAKPLQPPRSARPIENTNHDIQLANSKGFKSLEQNDDPSEEEAWKKLLSGGKKLTLKPIAEIRPATTDLQTDLIKTDFTSNYELSFSGYFRVGGALDKPQQHSKDKLSPAFDLLSENPKKFLNLDYMLAYLKRNLPPGELIEAIKVLRFSVSQLQVTDFYGTAAFRFSLNRTRESQNNKELLEKVYRDSLLALVIEVSVLAEQFVFRFVKGDSFRINMIRN